MFSVSKFLGFAGAYNSVMLSMLRGIIFPHYRSALLPAFGRLVVAQMVGSFP